MSSAYKAFLEEWIYFLWVWEKYIDNWKVTRESIFRQFFPFYPFRVAVYFIVYRNISATLYGKGITRHSREDIVEFIKEATKALNELVGKEGFFEGRDCSSNATLFGMLVAIQEAGNMTPIWNGEMSKYPNLIDWTNYMKRKYFPERVN